MQGKGKIQQIISLLPVTQLLLGERCNTCPGSAIGWRGVSPHLPGLKVAHNAQHGAVGALPGGKEGPHILRTDPLDLQGVGAQSRRLRGLADWLQAVGCRVPSSSQ